ncbi:metal ABC transporter ATP-binding protein [Candidatus Gottesmanbacteria bacterium]|nr:metal ABC transporter ATP-binding protein [Candidatus Gottesmanbacteria bacterium]
MKKEPIIKLETVSFSYNGGKIIDRISLEIKRGDYVGIIGPNGGGKTTLLRLVLNLLEPQSGLVYLSGQPVSQFREWSMIGYIPQKATQFETRFPITVGEVVSLGTVARKGMFRRSDKADEKSVENALHIVGMEEFKSKLITELSGGEQQRVFIAKALASEPDLLILDEPTVGIDLESQEKFYELLQNLNQRMGKTIIIVSHDIDVTVNEVSVLVCINRSLIYHGEPKQFIKKDYLEKLYGKGRRFILHGH